MKASTFCLKTWKTRQQWEVYSVHCTAEPQPLLFFSVCSTVVETHNWRKIYPSYSGEFWSMYWIFFCLWGIPFWNGLKEFIPLQFLSGISFKCLNVGICIFIPGFINMKTSSGVNIEYLKQQDSRRAQSQLRTSPVQLPSCRNMQQSNKCILALWKHTMKIYVQQKVSSMLFKQTKK